jgi:hypothetical protein
MRVCIYLFIVTPDDGPDYGPKHVAETIKPMKIKSLD